MKNQRGFTLIEIIVATTIFLIVSVMSLQGVHFLQRTLSHQMRLDRMSQALDLTQEISREVRSARRIIAVGPGHLDLEAYDYASYGPLDPRLYENPRRILYEFRTDAAGPRLVRDIFTSTMSATPSQSATFLSRVNLIPPTDQQPFFFASYLVRNSTVGVRVALALHPPYSDETWVPAKNEVYVKAE